MVNNSAATLPLFPQTIETKEPEKKDQKASSIIDKTAQAYWKKCLYIIKDNIDDQVFKAWFEPIEAHSWSGNQLTVLVPSQFYCEWIEEHYFNLMRETLIRVLGEKAKLQYEIVVDDSKETLEQRTIKLPALKYPPAGSQNALPFGKTTKQRKSVVSSLNPRYSFDNFITGDHNQLASSAGMAVSNNPGGTRYNPLVVYGDTGLGKTHLAQAIGNEIVKTKPEISVLYTDSEQFTMDFINAIQNNTQSKFISYYRDIDVLIVDDIQFFSGKEKTQDNFFHTFNALHQAGKQLVLTSDRPPKELSGVDERLISRFQWGLTVDIQKPALETRIAILKRKSSDEGIELSDEIIEYLARHVTTSVRELEGTLISLIAKTTLDCREMSLGLAKEVVHGVAFNKPKPLTIDDIKQTVSDYYKLPVDLIESKSRKHEIALARQMSMYIAKQLTSLSLKSIGSHFSNRDHSTVLHSCQTIENYMVTDSKVKASLDKLMSMLKLYKHT